MILFDDDITEAVKNQIHLLDPVCVLINNCQSSAYTLADAAEHWLMLSLPERFNDCLKNRKNMALNKYALAANELHPKYRGQYLTQEQKDVVNIFLLESLDTDGLEDYQHFKNNTGGIFDILVKKSDIKPLTFWNFASQKHTKLHELATKLLRIPASSAQLERILSKWSYIFIRIYGID